MKSMIILTALFSASFALSGAANAADDMSGMKMASGAMSSTTDSSGLTDAVVKKVDPSTGMVTLEHGALNNINMPAMTMAYKAKDSAIVKQAKEGEKVKVRVENVGGAPTIVKLQKQ